MTDLRPRLGDLEHLVAQLRRDITPATAVLDGATTAGFPTSTRPGTGGTTNGGAGPVLAAVTSGRARTHPDLESLVGHLDTAIREARTALGIVHRHTPPATAQPDPGDPGCSSCARIGQWVPRGDHTGDLCTWCNQWRRDQPMPTIAMLEAHHQGRRMTTRLVGQLDTPRARPRR